MAISTIVVRGYGSFGGGVNYVPTRGYTSAVVSGDYVFIFTGIFLGPSLLGGVEINPRITCSFDLSASLEAGVRLNE